MSDIFSRTDAQLKRLKNPTFDALGQPRVKVPCDDMSTWLGAESCAKCPRPCGEV